MATTLAANSLNAQVRYLSGIIQLAANKEEYIVDRIVEEQKTEADAVSEEADSSTVIKRAIENALTGKK